MSAPGRWPHAEEPIRGLQRDMQRKRQRSISPRSSHHRYLNSSTSTPGPSQYTLRPEPSRRGSAPSTGYGLGPSTGHGPQPSSGHGPTTSTGDDIYSLMSPRSARYYQDFARLYKIPLPATPDKPGRMGETVEEVDAAIVEFIKPIVEERDEWMEYNASKARPPRVSEILKQFRYVQQQVDLLEDMRTPLHWENAPAQTVQPVIVPSVDRRHQPNSITETCVATPQDGITLRPRLSRDAQPTPIVWTRWPAI